MIPEPRIDMYPRMNTQKRLIRAIANARSPRHALMMGVTCSAFLAVPGHCWRLLTDPDPARLGRPASCAAPVAWTGWVRLLSGVRVRVDSCDEHAGEPVKWRRV